MAKRIRNVAPRSMIRTGLMEVRCPMGFSKGWETENKVSLPIDSCLLIPVMAFKILV
jgi:hypothetical protein